MRYCKALFVQAGKEVIVGTIINLSKFNDIVNLMGQACTAECAGPNSAYHVSFSPRYRETLRKDGLSVLRAQYPDIYDDLVDTTESRIFSVSKVTL